MSITITTEDIQKLASLSRIEVSEAEAESLRNDIGNILGYVGQVQETANSLGQAVSGRGSKIDMELPPLRNVVREDEVLHKAGEYTEALLSEAPFRDGNFLQVKKIL